MDGISIPHGWGKEILNGVLRMGQLVLSENWVRNFYPTLKRIMYSNYFLKKRLPEIPECAEILHDMMMSLKHNNDVTR